MARLNLASWLPAAVLVGNGAVLVQMHADQNLSLGSAIVELAAQPLGILVVLLLALVVATAVTQAFEYEVIQLLEGYDWARGPGRYLMAARVRRHAAKMAKLHRNIDRLSKAAFVQARQMMATRHYDPALLDALERRFAGQPTGDLDAEVVERARSTNWRLHLPAEVLYPVDELRHRLSRYPEPRRLLPTRLGNHMRAAEDQLVLGEGENIAGYVMRHQDRLPATIREEHHTYRTRLAMYCSLVPVFLVLAAGAVVALHTVAGPPVLVGVAAGYLVAGWVAYEAAVASAKGWGDAVVEMGQLVEQERAAPDEGR